MNPIPQYKLAAIAAMLAPDFGRPPDTEAIRQALDGVRRQSSTISIAEACRLYGVGAVALRKRIHRAGLRPVHPGHGRTGGRYTVSEMLQIISV